MKVSLRFTLFIALTVLVVGGLAAAQDTSFDPPGRVARLQYVTGQVSLQPGGVDDWVDASLNRPLTTADRIWTDQNSRAELTMASAALRMGYETSVTIVNLNDSTTQIELDQGSVNLSVRYMNQGDIVEVDTPNFAYTIFKPGEYRFYVKPDADQSWVSVRRDGDGEASGDSDHAVEVFGGQTILFSQGQSLYHQEIDAPGHIEFDHWCETRERQETQSASARYVAPGTVGFEDLDANGYWEPSPVYGAVWYPNVHPGWAPYREGHWAWVEPWGWTWVDDASWGFAPFHYGRWVSERGRWGWVPGPREGHPVYAPALVAWVGGSSFGVSVGIAGGGGVGWVALGWHDPFIPTYHVSPDYARNVNVSSSKVVNVTVINNYYSTTNVNVRNTTVNNIQYENVKVNGAVTAVPHDAFASGKSVTKVAVAVPAGAVGHASFGASANVIPAKAAVLGGHAPVAAPAHLAAPRQIVAKTPPPARPVSFEQQRPLLEKSNGAPISPEARNDLRKSAPAPARPIMISKPSVRPATPAVPPANANQKNAAPVTAPAANANPRNAAPVASPGGNPPHPSAQQPPAQHPVWTNDNIGHAPVANTGGQNQGGEKDKTVAPSHPATPPPAPAAAPVHPAPPPPSPAREVAPMHPATPPPPHPATPPPAQAVAPVHPATPPPPPAHTAAPPPPQHKNPPPKDNKEKDKEPKGH